MLVHLLAVTVALIPPNLPATDRQEAVSTALAAAKSLTCEFPVQASGTWSSAGVPQAAVGKATLTIGFLNIDAENGTADASGTFGSPHIIVRLAGEYLHFMQVGSAGFLYTTTVFNQISRDGKRKAVHTRHEYTAVSLPGYTSRPEQYYGECTVVP